jgi:DUF1365 family protein
MTAESPHAIYEGWVSHRRTAPVSHEFRYRIHFAFLDLDFLPTAFAGRWLWSLDRANLAALKRSDHFGDPSIPWADAIRQLVLSAGIDAPGRVCLLTQPRYFGFVMNPVSFYFCYGPTGNELRAVVAEVHNTPWGEQHCYVLPVMPGAKELWLDKLFHVSPFMPMQVRYRWEIAPPGDSLAMRIENYQDEKPFFEASVSLRRRPWSTAQLNRALLLQPLMTQRIYAAIYWQALRLWWKGTPYFPHPGGLRTIHPQEKLA